MYVEVFPNLKLITISPDNDKEKKLLRSNQTEIKDEDKLLVYWGDTEPKGVLKQGLKISWKDA